jgi:hypothetical protein
VQSLRDSLRQLGSDLVLLRGPWEQQLPRFAAAVGAGALIAELEVEWEGAAGLGAVRAALPPAVSLQTWSAPLFAEFVENFKGGPWGMPAVCCAWAGVVWWLPWVGAGAGACWQRAWGGLVATLAWRGAARQLWWPLFPGPCSSARWAAVRWRVT